MENKFICRKKKENVCKISGEICKDWINCKLKEFGAPCPMCTASSPLEHLQCDNCDFKKWKKENYIQ